MTDATTIGLTLSHLAGENGKPLATIAGSDDFAQKKIKYERIDDVRTSLVQLAFFNEPGGPLDLRGWTYYSSTATEENGYDDAGYTTQTRKSSFFSGLRYWDLRRECPGSVTDRGSRTSHPGSDRRRGGMGSADGGMECEEKDPGGNLR